MLMDKILFLVFSSIEEFSILLLGLILFRVRHVYNILGRVVFLSVLVAVISFTMRILDYGAIVPVILLLLVLGLIKPLFKVSFKFGLAIATVPLVIYALIQSAVIYLLEIDHIEFLSIESFYVQIASFIPAFLISIVANYIKHGFSYDPEFRHSKNLKYSNKIIGLLISVPVILIYGIYFMFVIRTIPSIGFYIYSFIAAVALILIIFIFLKRDEEEAKHIASVYLSKRKGGNENA